MRDDFLRGDWAAEHHQLSTGIDKLTKRTAHAIGEAFDALTRQQFDAPWQHRWRQVKIGSERC